MARGRSSGLQTFRPSPDLLKRKRFAPARSHAGAGSHHPRPLPSRLPRGALHRREGLKFEFLPLPRTFPTRHDSRHVAENRELETEAGDGVNLRTWQRKHLQISKRGNPLALG